jgi:hypothetical protein
MKKISIIIVQVFLQTVFLINLQAQEKKEIMPPSINNSFKHEQLETIFFSANGRGVLEEKNTEKGNPFWAGYSEIININPNKNGTIIHWDNNEVSWIIKFHSPETPALGVILEKVKIPSDARFYIYSDQNPNYYYVVSAKDVVSGYISTPHIPYESIVIEYVEKSKEGTIGIEGSFLISELVHIYNFLDISIEDKDLGDSEACQVNIKCAPEGDNWQQQKQGIARMIFRSGSNWYYCTGTLINNTNQDGTPYFLTAEHCGGDASQSDRNVWQFYFNYERPGCENTGTPPTNLVTGCDLKAKGPIDGGSDFQLLLLSSTPPIEWNPYYNGWSRSTSAPTSGVSIHHPSGDAKKISTYTETLTSATPNIGGSVMATNSAWRVTWSETINGHGVTEGGSSGSPIFNSQGLVVGTLSGGSSSCSSTSLPDFYGKFDYHWISNGTTSDKMLQTWLDPASTGTITLQGYSPGDNFIDILSESFEGTSFPPANWELQSSSSNTWKTSSGYTISGDTPIQINPYDGQKFVYIQWHGTQSQNEWLITPTLDLKDISGLALSFYFNGSYYWSVSPNDNCDLKVKAKIGDGSWTDIWNEENYGQWSTYEWHNVFLTNLSEYEGKSAVKFAFVYTGTDGANFNIDKIFIGYEGLKVNPSNLDITNVYPNPFNNILSLKNIQRFQRVTISNTLGQIIFSYHLTGNEEEALNLSFLQRGLYILTFYTEKGIIVSRKIIKR